MESKVVYLDGDDSVRAIVKPEQNTLILRDLPSGTKLDDVIGIFERAKDGSSSTDLTPVGVRSDMMDTWCVLVAVVWLAHLFFPSCPTSNPSNAPLLSTFASRFVTFSSEAAARNALQAIQLVKYNDKRISARLKTTAPVKPIYTGRGGPGPQGGQQQNQPSPQGSGQGIPSPVGQPSVGAYPARPEFYGGPISPEYASPMGMIAPPMFFAAYPGMPPQPMGPGGYPMGPPMGPGGMGMPPMAYTSMMMPGPGGKWSPNNAMPMMGMGGPMGGQGPSPRNNMKGRSQRMQYPPYEGPQGQWGNSPGHRGGGYGGGGAPAGRHLNEGGGGYSKQGNAPYSDRSGERSNRTFRRDGGNGDGRLGSGSQDGNDGMGSHSGDRGDDRHNGGSRPRNGARNDARGGDIRSGDRRYQGDMSSAGGDSGAEHDSRDGPQGAASRFHQAQGGDSAGKSAGGGGSNNSNSSSGGGAGGLASRSNDRQEDTATSASTTTSTSASMSVQHLDQIEVSDGASAMAVSPGPGEDVNEVAASASGVRGSLKKTANVARSEGGTKPDGEAGEAGSRFIKKDGVPIDSRKEGTGAKSAGAGSTGGAKVPSQRTPKDREARDKPKKEPRQPEFDFSSASDFPMIAGGDSAVPSPTAAVVVTAQAKPTFGSFFAPPFRTCHTGGELTYSLLHPTHQHTHTFAPLFQTTLELFAVDPKRQQLAQRLLSHPLQLPQPLKPARWERPKPTLHHPRRRKPRRRRARTA